MTRAKILQEVRQMRFEELYARRHQRTVTMAEAALTERTLRRWSDRHDAEGAEGLQDRGSADPRSARCPWIGATHGDAV